MLRGLLRLFSSRPAGRHATPRPPAPGSASHVRAPLPPPPPPPAKSAPPPPPPPRAKTAGGVRVVLADGRVAPTEDHPELAERISYLARNLLPPQAKQSD
ncbi:MAG: hypothetical protein ACRDKB_01535 [Actinomycetota bacterium]